ncbi:unnamed protein product, partial [Symbiodinium sp. CCMP2592]
MSEFGESGWLDLLVNEDEATDSLAPEVPLGAESSIPGPQPEHRGRGRPPGLRGSHTYRAALRAQEAAEQQLQSQRSHSVEDARLALQKKRESTAKSSSAAQALIDEIQVVTSGSVLQQGLNQVVMTKSLSKQLEETPEETARTLMHEVGRSVTSLKAESDSLGESTFMLCKRYAQCASGIINFSGLLWEQLLVMVAQLCNSECGQYKPLLLVVKRRYDETPSRIRVPAAAGETTTQSRGSDGSGSASKEKNALAKVLQSELQVSVLLQQKPNDESAESGPCFLITGQSPTWLQAIERNTAECLRQCQKALLAVIPKLNAVSATFALPVSMVNTDRFSANYRCERAIQLDHPHFVKCHYGCDHHACATVLGKGYALDIPKLQISSMIASAMCMLDANSLRSLQECLMVCIDERLRIRAGPPPDGRCKDHQAAVYDCFLGPVPEGQRHRRAPARKKSRRRCLLTYFFNGDLESDTIDFWTTELFPNREAILQCFFKYVVPSLLPSKAPIFPRGRWTHSELATEYFGLLDSHNQLLGPLAIMWLQRHGHKVSVLEDRAAPEAAEGWAALLVDNGPAPGAPAQAIGAAEGEDEQHADGHAHQQDHQNAIPEEDQNAKWHEERRQWRSKFAAWAQSSPGPYLLLMRIAIGPTVYLTYALLELVGDAWEKVQAEKAIRGSERSFPVLEASRGVLMDVFWAKMHEAFHKEQVGLPLRAWTRHH